MQTFSPGIRSVFVNVMAICVCIFLTDVVKIACTISRAVALLYFVIGFDPKVWHSNALQLQYDWFHNCVPVDRGD